MYVQTTLDVHKKYNALVMSAFNNDAGFVAALDKVGVATVPPLVEALRSKVVAHRPIWALLCFDRRADASSTTTL